MTYKRNSTTRMPVIFAGHGSPLNAIDDNRWSRGFADLAGFEQRPRAVLVISAHWYTDGTLLTGNASPRTIHDFRGFPQSLYEIDYPAAGNVNLASRVRSLLGETRAELNADRGLDHGAWSVLRWMYPMADVPVIQLSIDRRLDASRHFEIGRALAELREESVLILASGNIVHNLSDAFARQRTGQLHTPDWAQRFDMATGEMLAGRETDRLLAAWSETDDGRRAHPTPEHWLPLLYAYGASDDRDAVSFPTEGFDLGSLSMRNVVFSSD